MQHSDQPNIQLLQGTSRISWKLAAGIDCTIADVIWADARPMQITDAPTESATENLFYWGYI